MINMSLEIIEKEPPILKEEINDDDSFNYSKVVIPFSDLIHRTELLDVYSGAENIPFEKRDTEYKKILLNEFM